MARKPAKTYDEQLADINMLIEKTEHQLKNLKSQRQEIFEKKKESELNELYKYMQTQNLSMDEVIKILNSSKNGKEDENKETVA